MKPVISELLRDFERGPIGRRQLLRALGLTGAASLAGACAQQETAPAGSAQTGAPAAGQVGAPSSEEDRKSVV